MQNCPERDCHQRVEDVHHEVFDKPDGLKEQVSRMVSWTAQTWVLLVVLAVVSGIGGVLYAKGEKNNEKISGVAERTATLEGQYTSINKNTEEILKILREQSVDKEVKESKTAKPNDDKGSKADERI